nr:Sensor histidine kinase LiaS [Paraburkholderia busanensis]
MPDSVTWIRVTTHAGHLPAGPLVLYGSRVKTDGTVAIYADGRLVYRAQRQGPLWNSLFTPLWIELDRPDGAAPPAEILVRLTHTRVTDVGLASLWLGTADALRGRYVMRQWLQRELPATLSAAFLMVGGFALFVWLRRRRETGYLLFFNLAATSFVAHLHYYAGLPITDDWFAWVTINALLWMIVVVHFFLCQTHGRPFKWLTYAVVGVSGSITILTLPLIAVLPVLPNTPVIVPLIYAVEIVIGAVVGVAGVLAGWRRSREARLVATGVSLCIVLGISDWAMYNNVVSLEGWFLGAYMNAVTFAIFGLLIYRRYVTAIAEVEQINVSLAERLQAREDELEESHRLLREAELKRTISDERQRLMQDMHDGLGSSLISAIRSVERGDASSPHVSQILKSCLDDLKLTIDSMEPVEADLLLLLATLRFRLEPRLERSGVTLRWDVQKLPTLPWLDPSSALHILRIVQESIANVLAHTRASEIRVGTAADVTGVRVVVEDNGQGFDVEKALGAGKGHGLRNQLRRAQAVDGTIEWAASSTGTRFTLWLPLARDDRKGDLAQPRAS